MIPDVSIIVVAYNGAAQLHATLDSVTRCVHDITYELIVIDNASTDRALQQLVDPIPQASFVRNERNLGFAAANNIGMRLSRGRYVALLNPDTLLHNDALAQLVRWLDAHPHVGAVGPQLVQPSGAPQPYSYGAAPTPRYLLRRLWSHLRGRYLHAWSGTAARPVDWVAGTCMVVRKTAIEAVGLLDERFFLYFEDVDWGLRLNTAGWPVMFLPTVSITHIGGGSVGARARRHYDRSLVRLYAKQYGPVAAFGACLALRLYRCLQQIRRRW